MWKSPSDLVFIYNCCLHFKLLNYKFLFQFLVLSYVLNIVWMGIVSLGVIPIILYVSVSSVCSHHVYGKRANNITYCFDISNYGELFFILISFYKIYFKWKIFL